MSHLILFFMVSIGSAQTFTFNQTATGPNVTCRGGSATFTCRIVNDGGFLQSNQWSFSNATVITIDTPNHMFSTNPAGLVTDLVVSNVDANTSYICGTVVAPSNFTSTTSLTVAGGPPSPITISNSIDDICTTTISGVSWSPSTGDPVCGPVSYNVMISPSDGVMIMRITNTSYNFTGLTPGTSYTVSVAGMNMAGVGESDMMMFRVTMAEAVPSAVTNLRNTTYNSQLIRVTWNAASSRYCGDVLYYEVMISSDEDSNIPDNIINVTDLSMLTATFFNLMNTTMYNITVVAGNRAGTGTASTVLVNTSAVCLRDCDPDSDSDSDTPYFVIPVVVVVVLLLCCCQDIVFYCLCKRKRKYCPEKEFCSEPTSGFVFHVVLGIFTFGLSLVIWYIYVKCTDDDKDKEKYCRIVHVALIVVAVYTLGTSYIFWLLYQRIIHACCNEVGQDPRADSQTTRKSVKPQDSQQLEAYASVDVASRVEEKSREEQLEKKKKAIKGKKSSAQDNKLNYLDPNELEIKKGPGTDSFGGDHTVSYGQVTESTN